ncbi:MAG: hypothetical protein JNM78_10595 [Cyclobacteriaceae bacterium]|nr:hypothetical protein [Cyclobacteriaceae bacterium]
MLFLTYHSRSYQSLFGFLRLQKKKAYKLTRKLKEGGRFLEIQLLDHVIVTTEGYYSFADEGLV